MTTMTSEATTTFGIDLVGRPAVVDHELTTVATVEGGEVFTVLEPGQGRGAEEVTTLPVAGEFVEIADVIPEAVNGCWLGPVEQGPRLGEHLTALVLVDSSVREVVMPVTMADARRIVRAGTVKDGTALEALLAEARAHRCTQRKHSRWVDQLVAEAHEEADDRGWCEEFDSFMQRAGLPRRTRDYDLCVEVTATVRVTRCASSAEEAIDGLTREDVWDAIGADNIEWSAEED